MKEKNVENLEGKKLGAFASVKVKNRDSNADWRPKILVMVLSLQESMYCCWPGICKEIKFMLNTQNSPVVLLFWEADTGFYVILYSLESAYRTWNKKAAAMNEWLNQVLVLCPGDKEMGEGGPKRVSVDKDPTCFTIAYVLQGVHRMWQCGLITSPATLDQIVISRKEASVLAAQCWKRNMRALFLSVCPAPQMEPQFSWSALLCEGTLAEFLLPSSQLSQLVSPCVRKVIPHFNHNGQHLALWIQLSLQCACSWWRVKSDKLEIGCIELAGRNSMTSGKLVFIHCLDHSMSSWTVYSSQDTVLPYLLMQRNIWKVTPKEVSGWRIWGGMYHSQAPVMGLLIVASIHNFKVSERREEDF